MVFLFSQISYLWGCFLVRLCFHKKAPIAVGMWMVEWLLHLRRMLGMVVWYVVVREIIVNPYVELLFLQGLLSLTTLWYICFLDNMHDELSEFTSSVYVPISGEEMERMNLMSCERVKTSTLVCLFVSLQKDNQSTWHEKGGWNNLFPLGWHVVQLLSAELMFRRLGAMWTSIVKSCSVTGVLLVNFCGHMPMIPMPLPTINSQWHGPTTNSTLHHAQLSRRRIRMQPHHQIPKCWPAKWKMSRTELLPSQPKYQKSGSNLCATIHVVFWWSPQIAGNDNGISRCIRRIMYSCLDLDILGKEWKTQ